MHRRRAASRFCSALLWCKERLPPARRSARAHNNRACCASSRERASAVAHKRATRASHPTKFGPGLARGSTALHRRRAASRSCISLPWCTMRLPPARRGALARNKRACCASSPERASAVARKRTTRASHPTKFGPGLARGSTALHQRRAAFCSCVALLWRTKRLPPAWRDARAQQARVLRLFPRESQRNGAQARYTRKPPHEVRARAGTWERTRALSTRALHRTCWSRLMSDGSTLRQRDCPLPRCTTLLRRAIHGLGRAAGVRVCAHANTPLGVLSLGRRRSKHACGARAPPRWLESANAS